MDIRTDGQKKQGLEVGAPTKINISIYCVATNHYHLSLTWLLAKQSITSLMAKQVRIMVTLESLWLRTSTSTVLE